MSVRRELHRTIEGRDSGCVSSQEMGIRDTETDQLFRGSGANTGPSCPEEHGDRLRRNTEQGRGFFFGLSGKQQHEQLAFAVGEITGRRQRAERLNHEI